MVSARCVIFVGNTESRLVPTGSRERRTVMSGVGAMDWIATGINGQDENVDESDVTAAVEVTARVVAAALPNPEDGGLV